MEVKRLYTCEFCRSDYADKENAIKCEKTHKKVSEIKDTRYSAGFAYPYKVLVKFEDGHEIWYRR